MSQWLPIHPTIVDPSTGGPLHALAVVGNMPIWPQFGAESDGSEGETEETETEETSEEDSEEETEEQPKTYSAEDYDRLMARMKAADRRASTAETRVKEFEKAGQSDLEKAQTEAQEAAKRAEAAEQALNVERIANAFLASNSVNWHDPMDALKMLRSDFMDGVEISEDGRVTGMKDAIKRMAREKKYLVNSESGTSASTSDGMNGKRKGDAGANQKAKDDELAKRMPALGRRPL